MTPKEIAEYIRSAEAITIILGAGASVSAGIPSANQLVLEVHEKHKHRLSDLEEKYHFHYGRVMGALSPDTRQKLIEPLLQKAKINWGHIALACLIERHNVHRILTFNFDLLLEKSAALLGMHLTVYDFGVAPTDDLGKLASPAIFHLHGQSYGLRLMNSEKETSTHKDALRPLLQDCLRNHLTLVLGYSGEADPAFEVMAEEFNSNNDLIWIGYSKRPKPHLEPLLSKNYVKYVGGYDFDTVMIKIAEELGCWPPEVVANPPAHVLTELSQVTEYPIVGETIDILTSTRKRLTLASAEWEGGKDREGKAQDALLRNEAQDPIDQNAEMSEDERLARAWSAIRAGNTLADEAEAFSGNARRKKYLEAGEKYSEARRIKPDLHVTLFNWGTALADEASGLFGAEKDQKLNEAGRKFSEALKLKPTAAEVLTNWGAALSEQAKEIPPDHAAEKEKKFSEAGEKYKRAVEIDPSSDEAYYNWANALSGEGRALSGALREKKFSEAAKMYAQSIKLKPDKHEAYSNWGTLLIDQADGLSNTDKDERLLEAEALFNEAKRITGTGIYNLACVLALRGRLMPAVDELLDCQQSGTLPQDSLVENDSDLANLRKHPRFKAFIKALR